VIFAIETEQHRIQAISAFFFAWISDKTKKRAIWLGVQTLMSITGLMITGYAKPHGARYLGLFLINMGASGSIPGIIAYVGVFFQVGNLT
jgi:predicted exporter